MRMAPKRSAMSFPEQAYPRSLESARISRFDTASRRNSHRSALDRGVAQVVLLGGIR